MDILKILNESYSDLYPEDFEFLETELATGNYEPAYIAQCRQRMAAIRNAVETPAEPAENTAPADTPAEAPAPAPETPAPEKQTEQKEPEKNEPKKILSPELVMTEGNSFEPKPEPEFAQVPVLVTLQRELQRMRRQHAYLPEFKKYIKENKTIFTPEFLDEHFSVFFPPEMDAIIMNFQMGEEFLEKYFGALDHDKIARYQLFSESFFIKHYAQLPAEVVLRHGKNEWRLKEKRSQKLGVFLRLKGVQF